MCTKFRWDDEIWDKRTLAWRRVLLLGHQDFDEFIECAKLIKKQRNLTEIKVAAVLEYLKKYTEFNYKAVRTWPNPKNYKDLGIIFPDQKMILANVDKIQICFFDKTLLAEPFSVIESKRFAGNQTI